VIYIFVDIEEVAGARSQVREVGLSRAAGRRPTLIL
jgi:hypothetical protein